MERFCWGLAIVNAFSFVVISPNVEVFFFCMFPDFFFVDLPTGRWLMASPLVI